MRAVIGIQGTPPTLEPALEPALEPERVDPASLVEGYFCVFTGRPELCTPYGMFATYLQAELFANAIDSRREILTFAGWQSIYRPER